MTRSALSPSELESAWPAYPCAAIKEYVQFALQLREGNGDAYAFRGVSQQFRNLWPSIDRHQDVDAKTVETKLLEKFVSGAWDNLTPQERRRIMISEMRWGSRRNTAALVVARHRGVPTRCLDWSDCPLRALYFVCHSSPDDDGEVWWFNRTQFDRCVANQWPSLFHKRGFVESELELDFIHARDASWFTAMNYMILDDDRLDRQRGWITVSGRLHVCHAEKIHALGVREKGRLVLPAEEKSQGLRWLEELGITEESLGLIQRDADDIARRITDSFASQHPRRPSPKPY